MLFMVMHKTNAHMESGGPADPAIVANMGKLIGETREKGMFAGAAGLRPSSERVRIHFDGGKRTLSKGPFAGDNELVSGFAMLKVETMDQAIEWATRVGEALGAVEVDVGPIVEPWHLGICPEPKGKVPLRVLAMPKADAAFEDGTKPSPEQRAKMAALVEQMKDADVFVQVEHLKPSANAVRLRAKGGRHTWTDGPFAESKELVAGFTILKIASLDDAKAWTARYADILGDVEVDVSEVYVGQ
jgi:hypothetical protein